MYFNPGFVWLDVWSTECCCRDFVSLYLIITGIGGGKIGDVKVSFKKSRQYNTAEEEFW